MKTLLRYSRILEAKYADYQRGHLDKAEYHRRGRLIDVAIDELETLPFWRLRQREE
jgi:hypothetical protein